jgi:GTPase SAR1 family protein
MVFDVTNRSSFDSISEWLAEVREHSNENIDIILCGNKIDLVEERMISKDEGSKWAEENDVKYFETSAKTNENECVDEAFHELILMVSDKVINEAREEFKQDMMRERKTTLKMEKLEEKPICC